MGKQTGTKNSGKRIIWIDGLRGIGCLCIFFHHFLLNYYPATYWGAAAESKIRWGLDIMLADFPFFFLINGNFWVCVYLFISGMVAVNRNLENAYNHKFTYYLSACVKRYLTLVLPVFLAEMLLFAANLKLPQVVIPDAGQALPFVDYLRSTFWSVLFVCDRSVIGALWTMQPIFLGGLLLLLIQLVFRKTIFQSVMVIVCMIAALRNADYWYFAPVMAGGLFGILIPYVEKAVSKRVVGYSMLIVGCFLAAYPSGLVSDGVYGLLPGTQYGPFAYHFLGAVFFIFSIKILDPLQKLFSGKIAKWLGKISYPFYVFHVVFIKITAVVFIKLTTSIHSYFLIVLCTAGAALVLCLAVSFIYMKFVEPGWRTVVGKIRF